MANLKTQEDIRKLRRSGEILATTLKELKERVEEGIVLEGLNSYARDRIEELGGTPAFLGYQPAGASEPYPASLCTSVNEEVVHGVPGKRQLESGDLLSLDLGVEYEGLITDSAFTMGVGELGSEAQSLMRTTREAFFGALDLCKPGTKTGDIGAFVENKIVEAGFSVLKNLTGHGVGYDLHEDPTIFNYGKEGTGEELEENMVVAIEPMASLRSDRAVQRKDGSFVTSEEDISAHFEATILITSDGYEVLTNWWE